MIDVSDREETRRRALAEGYLVAGPEAVEAVRANRLTKADPLPTARAAALLAVKNTPTTVPHCHPVRVTAATVDFEFSTNAVKVTCEVCACDRTGPQMEALCGVTAALLALYDLVKGLCPTARLDRVALVEKEGGRSGCWRRGEGGE